MKGSIQGCLRNENKPTCDWPLIMRKKRKAYCLHLVMEVHSIYTQQSTVASCSANIFEVIVQLCTYCLPSCMCYIYI